MTDWIEEKQKIVSSIRQIDAELAELTKKAPRRKDLVRQKYILIDELQKVKGIIRREHFADKHVAAELNDDLVTDHAVVRWLERKHGINMDKVKSLMLTNPLKAAISSRLKYWSDGEVVFIIDDGMVRTVIPVNQLREAA